MDDFSLCDNVSHFRYTLCGVERDFTLSLHVFYESLSGTACIGPLCLKQVGSDAFMALFYVCVILYSFHVPRLAFQVFPTFSMPGWGWLLWVFVWNPSFFSEPVRICRSWLGDGPAYFLLKQGVALQKDIYVFAADTLIVMFLDIVLAGKSLVVGPISEMSSWMDLIEIGWVLASFFI